MAETASRRASSSDGPISGPRSRVPPQIATSVHSNDPSECAPSVAEAEKGKTMTINISDQRPRISKREFLSRVAARSGHPIKTVSSVYEEILSELLEAVVQGETVSLTGFGRFYRQTHRGHKVRFGQSEVDDYSVLKFSASRILNRQLEPGPGLAGDEPIETERERSHSTSDTARSLVASA